MLRANIGITYNCNLNCKHCYSKNKRKDMKNEKNLNWWIKVLEILKKK